MSPRLQATRLRWDEARWAEVARLHQQGLSNREICRRWGVCPTVLSSAASKAGIVAPRRKSWWTPDRQAILREMRSAGALWREIGARLGCSENAARSYGVDRLGLPLGSARPAPPPRSAPVLREPLPPGHELTWGLLLALTPSLQGTPEAEYTGRRRIEVQFGMSEDDA